MSCVEKYGLHWFRRDLRLPGNQAFIEQSKRTSGKVLGIFCFDKTFLGRPDFSYRRFQFFIQRLESLKEELQALGSDLLVLDDPPQVAFQKLFLSLEKNNIPLPQWVSWSRDYEPFARRRDQDCEKLLSSWGVTAFHSRDHLLIEPHEILSSSGRPYQVYTPFARRWLDLLKTSEVQSRLVWDILEQKMSINWSTLFGGKVKFPDFLKIYKEENKKKVDIPIPEVSYASALEKLENFKNKLESYGETRDFPAHLGTSQLSLYFKNGTLTVPQVISNLKLKPYLKKKNSQDIFLSELIWREFYYHVLFHFPRGENESFLEKFKKISWENNESYFQAWKEGKTGYPIVDAGMRELKQTGWMHNRVRMIVASFLTKDLLIDWRWGEKYFMEQLLDGDLAPNNGGWQWAASTGCDPQPYFRIFNPWLQSKKFDPQGSYIKKFIPELNSLEPDQLHSPILHHNIYPSPIVDHNVQRNKALAMYQMASSNGHL